MPVNVKATDRATGNSSFVILFYFAVYASFLVAVAYINPYLDIVVEAEYQQLSVSILD